mmetsp:Transcript_34545/g.35213  ORF Transcript_34545/g.35213 Transcript_34545/m.35213 type:complete len:201 (+) Transcript_34545:251-853(+)
MLLILQEIVFIVIISTLTSTNSQSHDKKNEIANTAKASSESLLLDNWFNELRQLDERLRFEKENDIIKENLNSIQPEMKTDVKSNSLNKKKKKRRSSKSRRTTENIKREVKDVSNESQLNDLDEISNKWSHEIEHFNELFENENYDSKEKIHPATISNGQRKTKRLTSSKKRKARKLRKNIESVAPLVTAERQNLRGSRI